MPFTALWIQIDIYCGLQCSHRDDETQPLGLLSSVVHRRKHYLVEVVKGGRNECCQCPLSKIQHLYFFNRSMSWWKWKQSGDTSEESLPIFSAEQGGWGAVRSALLAMRYHGIGVFSAGEILWSNSLEGKKSLFTFPFF